MTTALHIDGLVVDHMVRTGLGRSRLRAVDHVDLTVEPGGIVGLVGESGCGKSSVARAVVGLTRPTSGRILLNGVPVAAHRTAAMRRRVQMVFQDPHSSLDPRLTVARTLAEPLRRHRIVASRLVPERSRELLELVGLAPSLLDARPEQLSGGQRQRVAIARALSVEPDVLVADEAVAALDASVAGAVLRVLADLRKRLGLSILFISHDLAVVRDLCDRVAVMYLGRIVEQGPVADLFADPGHPYTRALLAAAPRLHERRVPAAPLVGELPSPLAVPTGCRFHTRCPIAVPACRDQEPSLRQRDSHRVWCHFGWQTAARADFQVHPPLKEQNHA